MGEMCCTMRKHLDWVHDVLFQYIEKLAGVGVRDGSAFQKRGSYDLPFAHIFMLKILRSYLPCSIGYLTGISDGIST